MAGGNIAEEDAAQATDTTIDELIGTFKKDYQLLMNDLEMQFNGIEEEDEIEDNLEGIQLQNIQFVESFEELGSASTQATNVPIRLPTNLPTNHPVNQPSTDRVNLHPKADFENVRVLELEDLQSGTNNLDCRTNC